MRIYIIVILLFLSSCKVGLFDVGEGSGNPYVLQNDSSSGIAKTVIEVAEKRLYPIVESQEKPEAVTTGWGYGSGGGASSSYYSGSSQFFNSSKSIKIVVVKNTRTLKQSTDITDGRIVYKIPDVMKVRSTYKALVRISKSKTVLSIYDSLQGTVITSEIPITETMEVRLLDLSPKEHPAFIIVEINSAVQMIDSSDVYTEWSWSVTPVRVGNSKLEIVVSVIRNNNRKDIVYEDTVNVQHDILIQLLFFIQTYWLALLSPVIIPFILWLYNKKKKRKKS